MNENKKLNEARYFFNRMLTVLNEPEFFRYELSALLSAGRCVLQYALDEASSHAGGQAWYQGWMTSSRTFPFFRDHRNINIHQEPVNNVTTVTIQFDEFIGLSDEVSVVTAQEGTATVQQTPNQTVTVEPNNNAAMTWRHTFPDWPGSEDTVALCGEFLQDLQRFIDDGQQNRFITS